MLTETEPHYRQPLLRTPFHERMRAFSQVDSFIPWSGYSTVDVFSTVEQEYFAIRNGASLYDLTPMVKYRITGPDATRFLDRLVTRNIAKLRPGRVAYAVWCDDAGHLIDDGTVFRLARAGIPALHGRAAARLAARLEHRLRCPDHRGHRRDRSAGAAGSVLLLGPESPRPRGHRARWRPSSTAPSRLPAHVGCRGTAVMVSRTGFTGDLGYELWVDPADAERLWDALHGGRPRPHHQAGGLPRAQHRAASRRASSCPTSISSRARTPCATAPRARRSSWGSAGVSISARDISPAAARSSPSTARAPRRRLAGLDIAGTKPAHNALLYADRGGRREIGSVTSAAWSPTCKRNIALAMLDAPHFETGRQLWAEIYLNRELTWERRMVRARVVERPFFAPARRRAVPPGDF